MHSKLEELNIVLSTILYFVAFLFIIYGFVKVYQGEKSIVYFLLGGCFGIISTGKKIWNKRKDNNTAE